MNELTRLTLRVIKLEEEMVLAKNPQKLLNSIQELLEKQSVLLKDLKLAHDKIKDLEGQIQELGKYIIAKKTLNFLNFFRK